MQLSVLLAVHGWFVSCKEETNPRVKKKKYFMVVTLEASGVAKNTVASMLSNDENSIL